MLREGDQKHMTKEKGLKKLGLKENVAIDRTGGCPAISIRDLLEYGKEMIITLERDFCFFASTFFL